MEQDLHSPQPYDYRQYDRIWQRVAPRLEPYPAPAAPQTGGGARHGRAAEFHAVHTGEPAARRRSQNPCCMGTAAADMLDVLTGFIEESLTDRQYFLAAARQGPAWARQRLRDMAADEAAHARRLMAVHYLITGSCYRPALSRDRICIGQWCPALRERYTWRPATA